jgi:hypothetical protein
MVIGERLKDVLSYPQVVNNDMDTAFLAQNVIEL